jgi:hypothetical protein
VTRLTLCALVLSLLAGTADAQPNPVKIGVLNDQSGIYADLAGPGSVVAARLAVEDAGGSVLGRPVEVVVADHQGKPDIGAAIARRWYDADGVSATRHNSGGLVSELLFCGRSLPVMAAAVIAGRCVRREIIRAVAVAAVSCACTNRRTRASQRGPVGRQFGSRSWRPAIQNVQISRTRTGRAPGWRLAQMPASRR